MSKTKQRHHSWVVIGSDSVHSPHDWTYAFRTYDKACAFVEKVKARLPMVVWVIYPCELMTVDEAYENVEYCIQYNERREKALARLERMRARRAA